MMTVFSNASSLMPRLLNMSAFWLVVVLLTPATRAVASASTDQCSELLSVSQQGFNQQALQTTQTNDRHPGIVALEGKQVESLTTDNFETYTLSERFSVSYPTGWQARA